MAKYVPKPNPIEAVQWRGDNLDEIRRLIGYDGGYNYRILMSGGVRIIMNDVHSLELYKKHYLMKKNGVLSATTEKEFKANYKLSRQLLWTGQNDKEAHQFFANHPRVTTIETHSSGCLMLHLQDEYITVSPWREVTEDLEVLPHEREDKSL